MFHTFSNDCESSSERRFHHEGFRDRFSQTDCYKYTSISSWESAILLPETNIAYIIVNIEKAWC